MSNHKKILVIGGIVSLLSFPAVSFAAWWNPFTWFNDTTPTMQSTTTIALEEQISELEDQVKELSAQISATSTNSAIAPSVPVNVATVPVTANKATVPINSPVVTAPVVAQASLPSQPSSPSDYSDYSSIPNGFSNNPPYYLGTYVKVTGVIIDFLAAGDRGANSDYIEIEPTNYQANSLPYLMLQLDQSDYDRASSALSDGDSITAYGMVSASTDFSNPIGIETLIPVIQANRIDNCTTDCSVDIGTQTVFPFTASSVQNNLDSIISMTSHPEYYEGTDVSFEGKVIQVLNDSGNSLIFIQDQSGNGGLMTVQTDSDFITSNDIKPGSVIEVSGTFNESTDAAASVAYLNYQLASPNSSSPYITNGTVTVI